MPAQDYSARTAYRPPARWYQLLNNRLGVALAALGLTPRGVVALEVRGRRSGRVRRVPVVRTRCDGHDHLVALAGESQWVRNVRAADGHAVLRRGRGRRVLLTELPVTERAPVLAAYLQQGRERGGDRTADDQARSYFGLDPDPTLDELQGIAGHYPVFRVAYEGDLQPDEGWDADVDPAERPTAETGEDQWLRASR